MMPLTTPDSEPKEDAGILEYQESRWIFRSRGGANSSCIKLLGFTTLESLLAQNPDTDRYCHGDTLTPADCCLVPQLNSERYSVPLEPYPIIRCIGETCSRLDAFQRAAPEAQADAQ